jgi:hypothetical protein
MRKYLFITVLAALFLTSVSLNLSGQMPGAISIQPENATFYDEITLTFDAELACYLNGSLAGFSSVGMHSGVTINGAVWQNVVAFNSVGANGQSPVLNANPDGTFSITFTPYEFYGFAAGALVTQICAVFNNGTNWDQDGRDFLQGGTDCLDFFIPIATGTPYEPGLNSIVPDEGFQGETINVQIFGVNTHFDIGLTQIWLEKDLNTINITSYYAVNDTLISAAIELPENAVPGLWTLYVDSPEDGLLVLSEVFNILLSGGTMPAAISIEPPDATAYDELTLTFNPEDACFLAGSLVGTEQAFIHSGVAFNTGETWQYIVDFNAIGANGQSAELTNNGDGTWSITYIPYAFYGFEPGSVVTHICAVFNDGTWDKDGRDFQEGTQNCADFFIPLNISTGTKEYQLNSIKITPNPAFDILKVESDTELSSFKIISIIGELVIENREMNCKSMNIDVQSLAKGIYFISFNEKNGSAISKMFIKK